jgi:hypothetical protein
VAVDVGCTPVFLVALRWKFRRCAFCSAERFVLEREITALRWFTGIQVAYFAITLSAVWFLVSPLNNQVREELSQLKVDTKELMAEVRNLWNY